MSNSRRVRSLAAAALCLFALAACAPAAEEPDAAPTVTQIATEAGETDAVATDSGVDPSASPEVEPDEPDTPAAPPAAPPADPPAATPTPAPPAPTPTVAVLSQQCTSGKLKITLTANYDNSYRKGITSVVLERQNEYDAWLDADATWLTADTGQGNQWTGNPPGHKNQRFQDELRITAKASGGATTVLIVPITANC
jgi:hypothetical protein